jgi:hypothetical protein
VAWVAGVLLVAIGVLLTVVYDDTGSQLRSQIDHDIAGDATQMSQALSLGKRPLAPTDARAHRRTPRRPPAREVKNPPQRGKSDIDTNGCVQKCPPIGKQT